MNDFSPRVVVWDLDGTVWSPEMYELSGGAPFRVGDDGTSVVDRRGQVVRLLGDVLKVLQRLREEMPHVRVGIASTCDEPEWAFEVLRVMRGVKEGESLGDMFHTDIVEIYKARDK
jgi:magnesium-dependent phosphatase 1